MLALVSVVGEMATFSMVFLHEEVFRLPQPCLEEQRGEEQGEKEAELRAASLPAGP